jgi:HK97 family phage prohead protease
MPTNIEKRIAAKTEVRSAPGFQLTGYASKYNTLSNDLGGFVETVMPGAFARSLKEIAEGKRDVKALVNHDPSRILGRCANGTLRLTDDGIGLRFVVQLDPNNGSHKDIYASVERGDIDQCSFAFTVAPEGQEWVSLPAAKTQCRKLRDVSLMDVSVVTYPAYSETAVAARSVVNAEQYEPPEVLKRKAEALARQEWRKRVNRANKLGKKILAEMRRDDFDIGPVRAKRELQKQLREGLELIHVSSLDKDGNGHAYAVDCLRSEPALYRVDYEAEPCDPDDCNCRFWFHAEKRGDARMLARDITLADVSSVDGRLIAHAKEVHRYAAPQREMRQRIQSAAR